MIDCSESEPMHLSPFFHQLRTAYASEIEDLSHDSEGTLVLQRRLTDRRAELDFLVHMLELSPEMVAAVFHDAFVFNVPLAMEQLLCCEPEDLPEWDSLASTITIAPWADGMVRTIRAQPTGDWFMAVAAGAQYMLGMSAPSMAGDGAERGDEDDNDTQDHGDDPAFLSAHDDRGSDAKARHEAGNDWMVEQGFDRKD